MVEGYLRIDRSGLCRESKMILAGIDLLLQSDLGALCGRRVGLVTNNVATTFAVGSASAPLTPTRLALSRAGVDLAVLFAPEHGLGASAADGEAVGETVDALTGLPVISLYGQRVRPTAEMLDGLDLLLFDIPDIGARFYTYIWTLSHVMEACAEVGLPLWVLDRPNPLGGDLAAAEGPMLDEATVSTFVGRWSMPIRHSLTAGELALLWNSSRQLDVDLTVVPARDWQRRQQWPDTGLPFLPLSPNMPNFEAALLYPGTCLFEGTNLSEGRGTGNPFQQCGAPWLDPITVAEAFNRLGLPGVLARAVEFNPTAGKYAGQTCNGIMLHVSDRTALRPVRTGLHLLHCITARHPDDFVGLPYPTAANAPGHGHFDRLVGRLDIRPRFRVPDRMEDALIGQWTECGPWQEQVQPFLLYEAD